VEQVSVVVSSVPGYESSSRLAGLLQSDLALSSHVDVRSADENPLAKLAMQIKKAAKGGR